MEESPVSTPIISDVASPDAPRVINEIGGSQSYIPVRFDLLDGEAMFQLAKVLHEGAEKHGANNWRAIPITDHINHMLMHAFAYLAGDESEEHLSHMLCRGMMAQAVSAQGGPKPIEET